MTEGHASIGAAAREGNNLLLRIAAALVMAPLAIAIAYAGGWLWTGLVTVAAIGLYAEWLTVTGARNLALLLLGALVLLGAAWIESGHFTAANVSIVVALGVVVATIFSSERRSWAVLGIGYALAASIASSMVRRDPDSGFAALMLVLLTVWATDIGGYFAGRLIGGPKLWPQVSPKKTWAGAVGGFVASLAVAVGFAAFDLGKFMPLLLLAAALSVAAQLGDLFESAVKRRFGVKDSSHIIPGHGGLMDRLDGFVAAIVLAAIFGFLRGGADGVGHALMVW
ncbi:phosphatidate cytidylyltransferase [Bradyrhizobium erythrophlei]|uniref:Phosphatidate cytidylyltransferase n=1 Tax=Bradyrhizobium erythrophlei TaxID=1437360 RepID=A0A1M7USM7_9BRAD|nr:phosphatidate cytidylyltransferase [Bradyrhizobium erythrophlei]SHN85968.1 phosphatidate cytidylyltransferase [Bradyrhizobium erythrophlei]